MVLSCPSIENVRMSMGVSWYRNRCLDRGLGLDAIFSSFVNGIDHNGNRVPSTDFVDIGLALDTLRGHWLSKW